MNKEYLHYFCKDSPWICAPRSQANIQDERVSIYTSDQQREHLTLHSNFQTKRVSNTKQYSSYGQDRVRCVDRGLGGPEGVAVCGNRAIAAVVYDR